MSNLEPNIQIFQNPIVLPKTKGVGVQLDVVNPSYGWKDLIGQIYPHVSGGTAPVSTLIKGAGTHIRGYAYTAGSVIDDITYHIPHDYLPGSDLFFHLHWKHSGTSISGNFIITWYISYCKGYNQAGQTFNNELTIVQTIPTANIASIPRYAHIISEFQLTNNGGDSTHLDTNLIEVDGILEIAAVITTIPTINGNPAGSTNLPFIKTADVHYQSTQTATKCKNYPFYV